MQGRAIPLIAGQAHSTRRDGSSSGVHLSYYSLKHLTGSATQPACEKQEAMKVPETLAKAA